MDTDIEAEDFERACPTCGKVYVPSMDTDECPHDLRPEVRAFLFQKLILAQAVRILKDMRF